MPDSTGERAFRQRICFRLPGLRQLLGYQPSWLRGDLPQFVVPSFPAQLPALLASALGIAIVGYSDNVLTARWRSLP